MNPSGRRVLFAGTWDAGPGYPRTDALARGLATYGVRVDRIHVPLPVPGGSKSRFLRSPWLWPLLALELWRAKRELTDRVRRALATADYEAVIVPYPGHAAVRWLRRVVDRPLVLDLFLSAHGTVIEDRRLFRPGSLASRFFEWLDRQACEAADVVLVDTPQHLDYVCALTGSSPSRFDWVPIGVPETDVACPPTTSGGHRLELLFFGTGVRLHGLTVLCDAVAAAENVRLTLVGGTAPERAHAAAVIPPERLELGGEFEGAARIRERLARCDLVAGIFGDSHKASMVVPFKLVHALEAGRPVLTADTPAIRALLEPGVDCLVCPRHDAAALAESMRSLGGRYDLLADIAAAGRGRFESTFSSRAIGERLGAVLDRLRASTGFEGAL